MKRQFVACIAIPLFALLSMLAACAVVPPPSVPPAEWLDGATTRGGFALSYPSGGAHGWAFGAYPYDITDVGYVEEEYFIEGIAQRYTPVGKLTKNGQWTLTPDGAAPYKTRFLVRRPANPDDFNGVVVVEWANVSGGFEMSMMDPPGLYEQGFAYVTASVQMNGLYGFPENPNGLTAWDVERYGSLYMPDDGLSYDIFTQIARAVGKNRPTEGIDPMDGFLVEKVIAVGASQSGSRVLSYANGVQPIENTFDAIIPAICAGRGTDFESASSHGKENGKTTVRNVSTRVREDINCKVLILNTQTEANTLGGLAQPDTSSIVSWQIAGATHLPPERMTAVTAQCVRDGLSSYDFSATDRLAPVDWTVPYEAALVGLVRWVDGGAPLPSADPLASINMLFGYWMDGKGNAKGGLRLPALSVPLATYDISLLTGFSGHVTTFSRDEIITLYPTHEDYAVKVAEAANTASAQGILLPSRAEAYSAEAKADWVATLWTDTPAIELVGGGNGFNTILWICCGVCTAIAAVVTLVVVGATKKIRRKRIKTLNNR